MANNKKVPTKQKNSLKRWGRVCFLGEFVSVISPYIGIGIANYEKYFIQYNGTKVSIGFALAMGIMGIAIYLISKKQLAYSFITLFVGWGAVTGILFLVKELLNDICYIMLFGWIGIAVALGLDITKDKLNVKANKIQTAIDKAKELETMKAYEEEVASKENKKNKVRF